MPISPAVPYAQHQKQVDPVAIDLYDSDPTEIAVYPTAIDLAQAGVGG